MILYPMPYFKGSIKYTPAHTVKYVLYVSVADKHAVCLTLFITHLSLFMHLHLLCQMKWSQAYYSFRPPYPDIQLDQAFAFLLYIL